MRRITPVGIDLGTTYSAICYVNAEGRTEMLATPSGSVLTPSVVLFDDDEIRVGQEAWDAAIDAPERFAENVKRDMGTAYYRRSILGNDYPPEVLQGCILRKLQQSIVEAIGEDYQVVITVPAYFDEARRKVTADAAKMSGLPVLDIVNEPTAAALAFGERLGYLTPEGAPKDDLRLVVYDLGGGTFDVTVIELAEGKLTTLATDGDYELGGVHWDARLAERAEQEFRNRWPKAAAFDERDRLALLRAARAAKHNLSLMPLTTLLYQAFGRELSLDVTRDQFEQLTADLIERTVFTTRQALQQAELIWDDVDRLLLVGGSTRMPGVRHAMQRLTGLTPDADVHPDEAVARGAAVFARYLLGARGIDPSVPKMEVTDVNAHGLGIEGVDQETLRTINYTIIPRNTQLPFEVTRKFVTKSENQRSVKVQLLEGDTSIPDQCSPLAIAAIKHLPPGLPKGTPIQVTYRFEANGRLAVQAGVVGHGEEASIELERVRGLSDRGVHRWKQVICQDGGYRDFEDAIAKFLADDNFDPFDLKPKPTPPAPKKEPAKPKQPDPNALQAAVDFGAPLAASQRLKNEAANATPSAAKSAPTFEPANDADAPTKRRPASGQRSDDSALPMVITILGHAVAAVLGIALGYYLLCWVRPDLNFLELDLPGLAGVKTK